MSCRRYGWLFGALLLAGTVAADPPPRMPPAGQKVDDAKTPADPAVGSTDPAADAKEVVLSYAKYKELLDEIARLKAKAKPAPPAKCQLKGRVEGGLAFFTAQFEFHAERPDAVFALACGQAKALSASSRTAGRRCSPRIRTASWSRSKTGRLSGEPRSVAAAVPTAGRQGAGTRFAASGGHHAGNGPAGRRPLAPSRRQGVDRDLVDLQKRPAGRPARSRRQARPELAGRATARRRPASDGARAASRSASRTAGSPPKPSCCCTRKGGPVGQWVLSVPAGAEVKAAAADQPRVQSISRADEAGAARYTVVLKEPERRRPDPHGHDSRPLTDGKRAPVGPFVVRGRAGSPGWS